MSYQGFCGKYGMLKMVFTAYASPVLLNVGLKMAEYLPDLSIKGAALMGLAAGASGFSAAAITHAVASSSFRKRNIGITRGSALSRRFQLAAYGATMATILTLGNAGVLFGTSKPKPQDTVQQAPVVKAPVKMPALRV